MDGHRLDDLLGLARSAVERACRNPEQSAALPETMLLASALYEELRIALRNTSRHEAVRTGMLAAAVDQCRQAVCLPLSPGAMASVLAAVLSVVEAIPRGGSVPRNGPRPRLRVIAGGRTGD